MEKLIKNLIYLVPFSILVVAPWFWFPYIAGKHLVFRTLIEVIFILWLVFCADNSKLTRYTKIVLGFCLIVGLSNILGINWSRSFWSNFERMDGYLNLLHFTAYFLVAVSVLKTKQDWLRLFESFIVVNFFSNLIVLILGNPEGIIGNTSYIAIFNLLCTVIILVHIMNEGGKLFNIFNSLALCINIYVMFLMQSRAVFVGVAVFLLAISFMYMKQSKKKALALLAVLAVFVVVISVSNMPKMKNLSFETPTIKLRLLSYKMALKGFTERPLLGYGQENYYAVYSKHYEPELFNIEQWIDNPHNAYLEWLIETGIIGLSAYLLIFVYSFYLLKKSTMPFNEKAVVASGLLAYMAHNLFMFDTLVSYLPFFTLLGYINYGEEMPQGAWITEKEYKAYKKTNE